MWYVTEFYYSVVRYLLRFHCNTDNKYDPAIFWCCDYFRRIAYSRRHEPGVVRRLVGVGAQGVAITAATEAEGIDINDRAKPYPCKILIPRNVVRVESEINRAHF